MGLGEGESPLLGPADPAARILEALLAVQDERERLQLLPSAFEPPLEPDAPSEVGGPPRSGVLVTGGTGQPLRGELSWQLYLQAQSLFVCLCESSYIHAETVKTVVLLDS